jgi:signal transduction histidine kinase
MKRAWRALASTTGRFIVTVFVLQLAAIGGVLVYVQRASTAALLSEQQARVGELRDNLIAGFKTGRRPGLIKLIDARIDAVQTEIPAILMIDSTGHYLAGNLDGWPQIVSFQTRWQTLDLYRSGSATAERIGIVTSVLPDGSRLLTGEVIESNARLIAITENTMLAAMLLAVPLTLLIAVLAGRFIDRRISGVTATTLAVREGDLTMRVPLTGGDDAFDRLGYAVNAMLDRIEVLVGELRVVTDSLAHDLRTPITRLKSTLERAIIETDDSIALAAMGRVSTEAETLLSMLNTALQISRAAAGIGRDHFMDTDLQDLVDDLVEVYGPYAEDLGFTLEVASASPVRMALNRELISQALGNLIENATRYAIGGTHIVIAVEDAGRRVFIDVADDGQGIPEDRKAEAKRRFGRLDPARHTTGSGLGLALVEAVANLHGGQLVLLSDNPGLRARLDLPVRLALGKIAVV